MREEKKTTRKYKKFIWVFICSYFLIVLGYYFGKSVGERLGLEYRFWVDACFRIWVWFVPILFAGIMILRICIGQWKRKSPWRWVSSVLLVGFAGVAVYASLLYALFSGFTMTSDEKMPDGNLVVAVPHGMESIHNYAEPVGLLFRRDFTFDEKRTADSLSKIYGVTFHALREENDQWIYASDVYPGIEVSNVRYGFTEVNYLDNNFALALTSEMLEEYQEVFASRGVELVSYLYGQSAVNPKGLGIYTAVLVSEENKERAAEAISEFIKNTLQEDLRPDGKSKWDCVDGSIFLVVDTEEKDKYQSIRNIPFSRKPRYSWIFDTSVTAEELAEKIVINRETYDKTEDEVPESIEEGPETLESSDKNSVAKESSQKCTFVNPDPYNGSGGESRWITFVEEKLGFSCLSHAAGSYGSLYRTEDGGISWEEIDYPSAKAKLPDGTYYNPFVMPEKVYEEDGALFMEAGQGADGDYYDGELGFCHGLYQSADGGMNWEFVKNITVVRE